MPKPKILLIHNFYQTPGGERSAVLAQQQLLQQQGHDVILYSRDSTEITGYGLAQKIAFFPNTLYSRRTVRELRALIAREKPDIAHVHNVFPLLSPSVYRALHAANIPIVQTLHNFRFLCPNGLFYRDGRVCELCKGGRMFPAVRYRCYRDSRLLSGLYAAAIGLHRRAGTFALIDRLIALNEFAKSKFVESGLVPADRIAVLGNFLPDPLPEPGDPEQREDHFVYLGRLSAEKGIFTLLEAVGGAPELRLKVLGTGSAEAACRQMVTTNGWSNIEFCGWVGGADKLDHLRRARALIMPSVCYENFPVTILEAGALATPVIASEIGSLPQFVVDGDNGVLFRVGDAADLRDKIQTLIAEPEQAAKIGARAYQHARRFITPVHYEALCAIYAELL